jgi:hypothetical protein
MVEPGCNVNALTNEQRLKETRTTATHTSMYHKPPHVDNSETQVIPAYNRRSSGTRACRTNGTPPPMNEKPKFHTELVGKVEEVRRWDNEEIEVEGSYVFCQHGK